MGCLFLLQGICLIQGLNMYHFGLLHWQVDSLPTASPGKILLNLLLAVLGLRLRGLSCSCGKQGLLPSWGARGLPLRRLLLFRSMGSRARLSSVDVTPRLQSTSSVGVPHGLSCSTACGISPDQGSNSCLWQSQVDSLPLSHQGSLSPGNLF